MSGYSGSDAWLHAQLAMRFTGQYNYRYPISGKDWKDIPKHLQDRHHWLTPVEFKKLPKLQMKVRMCCRKCEEKVLEEVWEVPGVFDVNADKMHKKVVVTYMPWSTNESEVNPEVLKEFKHELLKKAKKIDCKAKFKELDPNEKPKPDKPPNPVKPDNPEKLKKPTPETYHGWLPARPTEFHWDTPHRRPPPQPVTQDGSTPFYFLFLLILLAFMILFRR